MRNHISTLSEKPKGPTVSTTIFICSQGTTLRYVSHCSKLSHHKTHLKSKKKTDYYCVKSAQENVHCCRIEDFTPYAKHVE